MRDAITAERLGVPTAFVVAAPLVGIATETARAFAMPDLAVLAIPHDPRKNDGAVLLPIGLRTALLD